MPSIFTDLAVYLVSKLNPIINQVNENKRSIAAFKFSGSQDLFMDTTEYLLDWDDFHYSYNPLVDQVGPGQYEAQKTGWYRIYYEVRHFNRTNRFEDDMAIRFRVNGAHVANGSTLGNYLGNNTLYRGMMQKEFLVELMSGDILEFAIASYGNGDPALIRFYDNSQLIFEKLPN